MKSLLTAEEITQLLDAHFRALLLFARSLGADSPEDVVQHSILKLVRYAAKNGRPENVLVWLYRVIRNEATDRFRKAARQKKLETEYCRFRPEWLHPVVSDGLQAEEIAAALETLTPEQRETVLLRIWSHLSFDEIATLTETSRTTAHRRYADALETLKKKLG